MMDCGLDVGSELDLLRRCRRIERHFHLPFDDSQIVNRKRHRRRPLQHLAVTHVEHGAMQRADELVASQPALVESRVGVRADVVDRVQAVLRVAEEHAAAIDRAGAHLAPRQVRERESRLESQLCHRR